MSSCNCIPLHGIQKKQPVQPEPRKFWCIEIKQLDIKDPAAQRKYVLADDPVRDNICSVDDEPGPRTLINSYHEAEYIKERVMEIIKGQSTWGEPTIVEAEIVIKV